MQVHQLSVVIPVYRGAAHLGPLAAELAPYTVEFATEGGARAVVTELVLVHDCGPDDSARVMRELAQEYPWVRTVWLSRNFGQHPATIAGMTSSSGDWIITMDEDGQHDPADMGTLLDTALREQVSLVYARPTNAAPHRLHRRVTSAGAKRIVNFVAGGTDASLFHSYRLVLGEVGRSVAAYAGPGLYLDVALSWVAGHPATAPVRLREEGERQSGYSVRTLLSHFWRMLLSSGTRGLRVVSVLGVVFALLGALLAAVLVVNRIEGHYSDAQGWTSLMVVTLLCSGLIMFFLGVLAEYIGVAVNMAMGKPLYLITSDPTLGPLGRRPETLDANGSPDAG